MDNTQDIFGNQGACEAVPVSELPEGAEPEHGDNEAPDTAGELNALRTEISELREQLSALIAEQSRAKVNKRNAEASAGRIRSGTDEYFTPDEVRSMSQSEVRANYQKIKRSMTKWN